MQIPLLSLEITHRCNLNCVLCDHRIASSDYDCMTLEQYKRVAHAFASHEINAVDLTGGEPLLHPDLMYMAQCMRQDFRCQQTGLKTNCIALTPEIAVLFDYICGTHYPGRNDFAYERWKHEKRIRWEHRAEMWNPYVDPDLSEEMAQRAFQRCPKRGFRVLADNLYACCSAESIERYYRTEPIHVWLGNVDWEGRLKGMKAWQGCQRCFRSPQLLVG